MIHKKQRKNGAAPEKNSGTASFFYCIALEMRADGSGSLADFIDNLTRLARIHIRARAGHLLKTSSGPCRACRPPVFHIYLLEIALAVKLCRYIKLGHL